MAELLPEQLVDGWALFIGTYHHALDDKNRIIIPQNFRKGLTSEFFITISPYDTLLLFPPTEWTRLLQNLLTAPPPNLAQATNHQPLDYRERSAVIARVAGFAHQVRADKQWRVLIPQELRRKAKLVKDVVSVGAINKVELMSKEYYDTDYLRRIESQSAKQLQGAYMDFLR